MPVFKKKKGSDQIQIRRSFKDSSNHIGSSKEFEYPDRLNKRKNPIFIKRNIYLMKNFKKKVKDHGIFCSCSSSPGSSSTICGSDCYCGLLLSSCSSSCNCRSDCTNKPFQQRRIKKMKLVQTEKCGYGIVADEDIESGEFIVEYVGEVIDDKICEERLWKLKHQVETNFYLCQITWNMVIDATFKGNKSRYINHSCNPNTEMQKWIIDGEMRIGIFATRFISKGEHLSYDYHFVQYGADQECYCGEECCRRKLGAKPSKTKNNTTLDQDEEAVKPVASTKVTQKPRKVKSKSKKNTALDDEEAVKSVASKVTRIPRKGKRTRGRRVTGGQSWNNLSRNCIGAVILLARPMNQRCLGIIREFDEFSRKHLVMYEDGVTEIIDMSREVWKLVTV